MGFYGILWDSKDKKLKVHTKQGGQIPLKVACRAGGLFFIANSPVSRPLRS